MKVKLLTLLTATTFLTNCGTPEAKPAVETDPRPNRPEGVYVGEFTGVDYTKGIGRFRFFDNDSVHKGEQRFLITDSVSGQFELRFKTDKETGEVYSAAPNRVAVIEVDTNASGLDSIIKAKPIEPTMTNYWQRRVMEKKDFESIFKLDTAATR